MKRLPGTVRFNLCKSTSLIQALESMNRCSLVAYTLLFVHRGQTTISVSIKYANLTERVKDSVLVFQAQSLYYKITENTGACTRHGMIPWWNTARHTIRTHCG